jgi:hypothetical protein
MYPEAGMKFSLLVAVALFGVIGNLFSEPTDKEFVALMNKVTIRVNGGDIKALDELTALPGNWATPGLLAIFKQNYNIYMATPLNKAIGMKAAQLAISTDGGEGYLVQLLKAKPADNFVYFQQDSAIKCLVLVHDTKSIRILGGSLDNLDPEEIGPKVVNALASLNLPGTPVSAKERIGYVAALAKWTAWWASRKDNYM